jgi:small basic protein
MLGILLLIGIVIGIVLILPLPKGKREKLSLAFF